jgi:mannosyltransferase
MLSRLASPASRSLSDLMSVRDWPDWRSHHALRIMLLALICLAFALRLYRLDAQSLWYDEAVTVDLARRSLAELTRWTANDIQPPLYYVVMAGWGRLAGWSEWSLRFPSAFFGILAVPLLAVLAGRLSGRRVSMAVVALLVAVHPLLVYYSQEARMYTLLVAFGLVAAYCVVRGAWRQPWGWLMLGYVLAATAALYTHYFAFFLIVALVIGDWWEGRTQSALTEADGAARPYQPAASVSHFMARPLPVALPPMLLANGLVAILYLPWIGVLFNRLVVDRSYWQGDFKVVEALRSVAIHFTGGETVHEQIGVWLLLPYGLITLVALYRLWWSPTEKLSAADRTLRYALPWLLAPVAGVLTLAFFAPKFNPRYVLIALPGLLLLWGIGLTGYEQSREKLSVAQARLRLLFSSAGIIFLVLAGLWSNANWFFDRSFTKDDWRGLTTFLRPRLADFETVVLVSGHAAPVWNYYAPDLPVVRLPAIDVLDVDAVLTFGNTVEPLRQAFAEDESINGAWLVLWQDEVVDPTGIVPVQLELGGREKGQSAEFWGLGLRRFSRIRPHRIVAAAPVTVSLRETFGDQLKLSGYHLMEHGDLLLFWQRKAGEEALAADYVVGGETIGADGAHVASLRNRRPAAYTYPVARWQEGEVVMGLIPVADWLGPEPVVGSYTLRLTVSALEGTTATALTTSNGQTVIELPITVSEFD